MGNSDSKTGSTNNPSQFRSTNRPSTYNPSQFRSTNRPSTNNPTSINSPEPVLFSSISLSETTVSNVDNESSRTIRSVSANPTVDREVLDRPSNSATVQTNKKMAATVEDIESKLQKLNIKGRKDINILLLGETGVGKSTFINSIFNYLQFQDFATAEKENLNVLIPSSFTVFDKDDKPKYIEIGSREDKNELLDIGSSATQGVKTYTFYINNGQTMIRLIDTPGMGDTRGIEQDDINCENILNYISRIHELHAICYLFKPQQSRATAYFKYCVAQILSRLEKSACQNIVFVFTHTRGNGYSPGETFQLLKQVTEEISKNPAHARIPLDDNRFCFDNEAFTHLAAIKNGVEVKKDTRSDCKKSWNKSTEECWKMIEYIVSLRPHFVKHTSAINEARRVIYQLAQPMADIAQLVNDNIYALENHQAHLNIDRQSLGELKKRLYIPVIDLEVTTLTQPVTVCTDLKCCEVYPVGEKNEWHYKTRCHDPCYLTNVPKDIIKSPELIHCASMGPNQICTKCSHSYLLHMHVYYMTKKKHTEKKDDIVLKNINTKELVIENALKIIEEVKQRKSKLEKELNFIVKCNAKFAYFLQNNAIAPFSDSYAEYINHLIIKEKGLGRYADITKMAGLERLLREHNEMKKIFEEAAKMDQKLGKSDDVTPQDISSTMQELFKLEFNGKKIKELFDSQKKSISKEHSYSEYVHKDTFTQATPKPQKNDQKNDENKGKPSASNPTTKFQRGRQYNRGNYNNQRGRSAGPHQRDQRDRTPPPPYDSATNVHHRNRGYQSNPPQDYPRYTQPPPQRPHSSYSPPGPQPPYPPPQPPAPSKSEEKAPVIQVQVTLPTTPVGDKPGNTNNYPARDPHRDQPYPDHYRDYPRDYPPRDYPRDYPPRDVPPRDYRDYPPRDPNYPPRDPNYPPRDPNYPPIDSNYPPRDPNYPPRDPNYPPRDSNYPPRDPYYPPRPDYPQGGYARDTDYPPRDPYYPPRPDYPPRGNASARPDYAPRTDYPPAANYPPRADYPPRNDPPRDPYYDSRYPSSSAAPQYPHSPPPQQPYNNHPQGNYQPNQNRRGQDNRRGNFRGRGNNNRGGINRRYKKKRDNSNADSGDESDTSVASSKK